MWKKILKTRAIAKGFHRVEVKNGETTSFWNDHWSSMGRLIDVVGERGHIELGIRANETVAEAILIHRRRNHRSDVLNKVEEELDKVRNEENLMEDIALWKSKEDVYKKNFSSKNTWQMIRQDHTVQEWSRGVWFKHATPKYSFHIWTAMRNRLITCDRILKWNPTINPTCVLCQQSMETRNHLFFTCAYSSQIWKKLMRGLLRSRYTEDWEEIVDLLLDNRQDRIRLFLLRYCFQATAHTIWWERNMRKHGEKHLPYTLLQKTIDKNVRNRLSTIKRQGDHNFDAGLQIWFGTR